MLSVKEVKRLDDAELNEYVDALTKDEILEYLEHESLYLGSFGRRFLSASILGRLLGENPLESFYLPYKGSVNMTFGSYMHCLLNDRDKIPSFNVLPDGIRRSKGCYDLKEADVAEALRLEKILRGEKKVMDIVEHPDVKYEVPGIVEIDGVMFKGKADFILPDGLYDFKTTRHIDSLRDKCIHWGYHSQMWIYREMFGLQPYIFAIDKEQPNGISIAKCSEEFLQLGKERVMEAIKIYKEVIL